MNRISEADRERAAHFPERARRHVQAGVQCDHCDGAAIANVHDGEGVSFLCREGYLALLAERREERRAEVRSRFGLVMV